MGYQAKLTVPFGVLGIRCDERAPPGIDFLSATEKPQRPTSELAATVCEQLQGYFENPGAQVVGQACGANPIPIITPCHPMADKFGLGGFMRHASGATLDIKRWLPEHEQR
jgi:methylated-DNA-[protein]-cysteine S-methyltransferase